jgi:hypothetical protein
VFPAAVAKATTTNAMMAEITTSMIEPISSYCPSISRLIKRPACGDDEQCCNDNKKNKIRKRQHTEGSFG